MIIYSYTNRINGKKYIGKTECLPSKRMRRHRINALNGYPGAFYNAIRKYGWESFTYEVIDGANSASELSYREIHHIHANNSVYPNGYNLAVGNKKHYTSRQKHSVALRNNVQFIERLRNMTQASILAQSKSVKATKEDGSVTVVYNSLKECAADFDHSATYIAATLSGRGVYKPIKGYYIEYIGRPTIKRGRIYKKESKPSRPKGKPVRSINTLTNEIRMYSSIKEASKDGHSKNAIVYAIKNVHKTQSIIKWEFVAKATAAEQFARLTGV